MVETGVLAAAGVDLEYARLAGARPGPTLLLLHEGLGCVAMWKTFPGLLNAATGLTVLSYSRAGYGGSSAIALPRPIDFHTREALEVLPAVMAAAAITDCILVGHSDGASIALIYAGATGDPRVRALALMAPHVLTEDQTVMTINEARRAYQGGDLRERLARRHGANVDNAFWGWCDTWLDPRFRAWNIESRLAAIRVPVMTLRGDDDPYSSATHVARIAAGVAGRVETVGLPACGHAPHLDQPERSAERIARFVSTITDRR